MRSMRADTPGYANSLMAQGQLLVRLVQQGRLESVRELVMGAREGELLYYFTSKMFVAACEHHKADIVRVVKPAARTAEAVSCPMPS